MSSTKDMSTVQNATPFNGVAPSTTVRVTIVQSSTVYNDTPATIGNQSINSSSDLFLFLFFDM